MAKTATSQAVTNQAAASVHTMQCMEVWGGNGGVDKGVTMPGVDAWVYARPWKGAENGGDIHYVSSCGTGRIGRILVADVAGHGEKVSGLAVALRNLMRRYVNYVDQTQFVGMMNKEFLAVSEGGRFATALVATYFAPTNTLDAVNAGHPRPLVYSSERKEWYVLREVEKSEDSEATNLPLGVMEESRYRVFSLRMRPGDLVVIYTDSLLEAVGADGRQLGEEGLLDVIRGVDQSNPSAFAKLFAERVIERSGGVQPDDDLTILLLRPNGVAAEMTAGEAIAAQWKFLKLVLGSWRKGAPPVPWPEVTLANILGPFGDRFQKDHGANAKDV